MQSLCAILEATQKVRAIVRKGDCIEIMNNWGRPFADTIITDPPYGLKFMGKQWDHGVPGVPFWQAALCVAKPGAMLLAFGGTRTFHRLTCAIEDAGWEIRDCIMWLYGQGFPKSHNALKPAWEPIIVAMKPFDGTFADNALTHGVAGLNIDGGRIGYISEDDKASATPQGKCTSKEIAAIGAEPDAGRNLNRVAFNRPEQKGRWPTNVILDEEAGAMLDEQAPNAGGGKATAGGRRKGGRVYGKYAGYDVPPEIGFGDSGGASRFFYCAKASKAERTCGGKIENRHPTVKPIALMRYLCRLTKTPTGGLAFDPFCGSGSTLVAAVLEGRTCIGIDNDSQEDSVAIAKARLKEALGKTGQGS